MASGYPDFEGQKQKIYLTPEWATLAAKDKLFNGQALAESYKGALTVTYAVPSGKTLYLTFFGFNCMANAVANGDLNQMALARVAVITVQNVLFRFGGNGGNAAIFNTPIEIEGGDALYLQVISYANHDVDLELTAGGYEV